MNKKRIADRFARAMQTYENQAFVQREIAETLALKLKGRVAYGCRIAEFGCGTGFYSRLLLEQFRPMSLWLNDLVPAMENAIAPLLGPKVTFCAGDAEKIPFPEMLDVVTSASTLQWFDDIAAFFHRCAVGLRNGGFLAVSTFAPGTFHELHRLIGQGLVYESPERLAAMLEKDFEVLCLEVNERVVWFSHPMKVLYHLRQTGVTGSGEMVWTKGMLQRFCMSYVEQYGGIIGVPLTYRPLYILAKKKRI